MRMTYGFSRLSITILAAVMVLSGCRQAMTVHVRFDHINGLVKGARVLLDASPVGLVTGLTYDDDGRYTVSLAVDRGFSNAMTEYSRFRIIDDPKSSDDKAVTIEMTRSGGALLAGGVTVNARPPTADWQAGIEKDLLNGLNFLKDHVEQFFDGMEKFPESQAYRDFKARLNDLADELEQLEKKSRDKIRDELMPQLEKELDELKKRLRRFGREDEVKPLEDQMQRIRRI